MQRTTLTTLVLALGLALLPGPRTAGKSATMSRPAKHS